MNTQQHQLYGDDTTNFASIPHRGSLCKIHLMSSHKSSSNNNNNNNSSFIYAINIVTCNASSSTQAISSPIPVGNSEYLPSTTPTDLLDMARFNNEVLASDHYPHQEKQQPQSHNFELRFKQAHYHVMSDIFSILDTESRGIIHKTQVRDFIYLRCPVFRRRDRALDQSLLRQNGDGKPVANTASLNGGDGGEGKIIRNTTFEEVWNAVVGCSISITANITNNDEQIRTGSSIVSSSLIGIEGWMVFSRFIALAQYQEAKRRFSSRHLQHTMSQKQGGGEGDLDEGGNHEVVFVNVPPLEPPVPITVKELVDYETIVDRNGEGVALPELDLDHSHVSAHDRNSRNIGAEGGNGGGRGRVKIEIFGTSNKTALKNLPTFPSSSEELGKLDFVLNFFPPSVEQPSASSSVTATPCMPESNYNNPHSIVVKRSFADLLWLHNILISQKQLGGTLCGRILPPFPSPIADKYSDYHERTLSQRNNCGRAGATTTPAIAVASASVGMISSAAKSAKSFLGGYLSTSSTFTHGLPPGTNILGSDHTNKNYALQKDGSFLYSSLSKANQIERYLNFLLEHPALSSSFPLNVILKASQSGLECAKRILDNSAKHRDPNVDFSLVASELGVNSERTCHPSSSIDSHHHPSSSLHRQNNVNLSWIRTAAQAALALKLHGVLETTGCQSASAKLLHASLPNIHSSGLSSWNDVDNDDIVAVHSSLNNNSNNSIVQRSNIKKVDSDITLECGGGDDVKDKDESNLMVCEFEQGVVSIKSELKGEVIDEEGEILDSCCDEYDMLPAPMSLSKRSALCAGSTSSFPKKQEKGNISSEINDSVSTTTSNESYNLTQSCIPTSSTDNWGHHHRQQQKQQQRGYHYGGLSDDPVVLGDMSVDKDINKLSDILHSLNDTLGRCLAATLQIGEGVRHRTKLHMDLLGGLDSCEGIRGEIITQRALLVGVMSLEKGYNISDLSAMEFSRGLSWNKALASSAVYAAEEVRDAVKVSRTASRAKVAADAAAEKVQNELKSAKFSTDEEARVAQARVSNSQSQAIHAAVVEHEALTAKRRATMALAHDTKCWNVHRKREILLTCLNTVKAQRDAARQCTAAWVQLRDGLLDMSSIPLMTVQTRIDTSTTIVENTPTSNCTASEHRFTEEDEKDSLAMMMGCQSLESSSEEKHVYDTEHDLFVDHFAAISKVQCCEEESIMPKVIASKNPDDEDVLQHTLSSSNMQIMCGAESIMCNHQDDEFDESAQVCDFPENETSMHSHSSIEMDSYIQAFSNTSDACIGPDAEQSLIAQERNTNTEASKIEEELNRILAPFGNQSLLEGMDDSTNPSPPSPIVNGGDEESTIAQHANQKPIMGSCMERNLESNAGSEDVWKDLLENKQNTEVLKPNETTNSEKHVTNNYITASDNVSDYLGIGGGLEMGLQQDTNPGIYNGGLISKEDVVEEQEGLSEDVWNDLLENKQNTEVLKHNETTNSEKHVTNNYITASDNVSDYLGIGGGLEMGLQQDTNPGTYEGGLISKENVIEEHESLSEDVWNDLLENKQNTEVLKHNETTNSEKHITNNYITASENISDYLGIGGGLEMGLQQDTNPGTYEGRLISKENVIEEQKDALSSHQQKSGLTSSMQSLVDGLMLWGGQWDSEDDLSLPHGMAASLVMDESGILH